MIRRRGAEPARPPPNPLAAISRAVIVLRNRLRCSALPAPMGPSRRKPRLPSSSARAFAVFRTDRRPPRHRRSLLRLHARRSLLRDTLAETALATPFRHDLLIRKRIVKTWKDIPCTSEPPEGRTEKSGIDVTVGTGRADGLYRTGRPMWDMIISGASPSESAMDGSTVGLSVRERMRAPGSKAPIGTPHEYTDVSACASAGLRPT